MDPAELNKLKVVDLRKMCQDRGLDQKGVKAVLVERLAEALGSDGNGSSEGVAGSREESMDADQNWESNEASREPADYGEENDNAMEATDEDFEGGQAVYNEMDDSNSQMNSNSNQNYQPDESRSQSPLEEQNQQQNQEFSYQQDDSESQGQFANQQEYQEQEEQGFQENEYYQPEAAQAEPEVEEEEPEPTPVPAPAGNVEPEASTGIAALSVAADKQSEMESNGVMDEGIKQEYDENFAPNPMQEELQAPAVKPERQRKNRWGDKVEAPVQVKEEEEKVLERGSVKRRHSPSPTRSRHSEPTVPLKPDDEPPSNDQDVLLGWYDSDLNLKIDPKNFREASPMSDQAFAYIWAGARATYGFNSGKVYYETKLVENNDTSHIDNEPDPNVMRIGWSVMYANMQLGEEPLSFGYGGTGKFSHDNKFSNYGKPFQVGNVVGAYLDFESNPTHIEISYSVDGQHLGVAHSVEKSTFGSSPLFPHVLSKNVRFECNFGATTWFPPIEGFRYAGHFALEERIPGPKTPPTRGDCEIIMMCGLPGCGKTTWIKDYVVQNPEKLYNILGTNNLIDKMKVMGLPRKNNYAGRWDVLIEKCTKCLNKLLEIAAYRRRNYIIDQTNVYPTAQKRKMRNFVGFKRRAVVIVPTDEEFKKRCEKRDKEEGKDIPDSAVLDMKANFRLPEEGEIFDEVEFIELQREEAQKLVEIYNKEGRDAGYGKKQSSFSSGRDSRGDKKFKSEHDYPSRDRWSSGDRGRWGDRESRGGWHPRGGMDRDGDRGHRGRSDSRDRGRGGGWQDRMRGGPPMGRGFRGGRGGPDWRSRDDRDFDGGRGGMRGRGGMDRGGFRGRGMPRGGPRGRGFDGPRGGPRGRGGFGDRDGFGGDRGYGDRSYNDRNNFNDRSYGDRSGRDDKRRDGSERGGRGGSRDGDASQNRNQTASQNNMAQNQNAGGNWMQGYGQNQGWGAWNNYANQWNQYNAAAATAATQQQGGWKQAGYGTQQASGTTATTQAQQQTAAANANYTQAYQQQAAAYGQYPNAYNWNQYGQYAQQYSQWAQQWGQYGYNYGAAAGTTGVAAGATTGAVAGATNTAVPPPAVANK
nr:PREDICTED: heterogeneous nuclear ribonucleoprotein U-like protein 1 [Bemisia tabaci]